MWLNTKWYDINGALVREDGAYGPLVDSQGNPVMVNNPTGGSVQVESIQDLTGQNTVIYEAHYGLDQQWASQLVNLGWATDMVISYDRFTGAIEHTLGELASSAPGTNFESFHFVLNNQVLKDNRIPPYGMDYEKARLRNALPVPSNQFGGSPGGTFNYFDVVDLAPPTGAVSAMIELKYQPTSWEYIQFLHLHNDRSNAFLADEGVNLLEAWLHTDMAAPHVMASATWGTPPPVCDAPTPTLVSATPGNSEVNLTWSNSHSSDPEVTAYNVFFDQAGKAQLITQTGLTTTYSNTGLTNGQEYCYKISSLKGSTCESGYSNILCAIPNNQGQARVIASGIETGSYVITGKGKNQTVTWTPSTLFNQGDRIVTRVTVTDQATGLPIQNPSVEFGITGPETQVLTSGPSDGNGIAEVEWQTQGPNRKGQGGTTTGTYTSTTTNITASGYTWDGTEVFQTFALQ